MIRFFRMQSILILIFSFPTILLSQAPDTIWTRTYGGLASDEARDITKTGDNHRYVIAGSTCSYGVGNSDYRLIEINENGDTIWTKTYGTGLTECCYSITLAQDNGFILTGQQGDFLYYCLFYTIRTTSTGNILWERNYECLGSFAMSVKPTSDYGFIMAGCSTPSRFCLVKINSRGDTCWTGEYYGSYDAYGYDAQEHLDYRFPNPEKYYLEVGCTGAGSGVTSWDAYMVLTDSIGSIIQTRRYGRPEAGFNDFAFSIEPTTDGNYIVAGSTMSFGNGGYDVWLMKVNFYGDTLWTKTYGASQDDEGLHAIRDSDGGIIIVGYTCSYGAGGSDAYIIKTDDNGNLLWSKTVGGPKNEVIRRVIITRKHEYILAGYTESFGAGGRDAYVIKLGRDGSGIDDPTNELIAEKFELYQNYPNPFNSSTLIEYYLPALMEKANIEIYDVLGKRVGNFRSIDGNAGLHQIFWRPEDISSGMYFYKIQAGDYSETRRMMLIK